MEAWQIAAQTDAVSVLLQEAARRQQDGTPESF